MIDFGDSGDRALAATPAGALLDADRGRDARDQVHVRSRHLLHELAGIEVHGVQEPALSFREQQIKSERAFARAADAGDDDKAVARECSAVRFFRLCSRAPWMAMAFFK